MALLTLLPLPLAWAWKALIALPVIASLAHALWAVVLSRAPWSVVGALWSETGWTLTTASGRVLRATLSPSTYVGVRIVILRFRTGLLRRRSLLLTADNIDPEQLRRLRARLRLAGRGAVRPVPNAGAV